MDNRKRISKHVDFLILDIICLFISFFSAYYIRHNNILVFKIEIYTEMIFIIVLIELVLFIFYNPFSDVLKRGYLVELKTTFIFDSISMLLSITYLFVVKSSSDYSRAVLFLTYIIYFVISYVIRCIWKKYIRKRRLNDNINRKSLFIICKEKDVKTYLDNLSNDNLNYFISGICIIDKDYTGNKINGIEVVANKNNLIECISTKWIDEIFILTDYNNISTKIIESINLTGIPTRFKINDIPSINSKNQIIENFNSLKTIITVNRIYKDSDLLIKRIIDIIGSIVGIIFTIIIGIVIAPIIYIKSPGPIIYKSNRVGKNGKIFKFYKFRSMVLNADDTKNDLKSKNRNSDGMMFKIENDPRIIPGIGNFIRKTSIDEFPQFFNVFKGDMSLVGTRPPTLDEWEKYTPYYRSRLSIKPGITGLWQVSGRSNITDFNEVVRLDNEYINNWSINLDIKILFKTVKNIFSAKSEGAM